MITLALSQVLWSLAVSWTEMTGGDNGLPGVPRPWSLSSATGYFYFVFAVFVLCAGAMYVVVRSPFGQALTGIRETEDGMRTLGYDAWRYKFMVSLISAFFAGVAGLLSMYLNSFVSPAALSIALSAQVLLIILVGGTGRLFGSIIGAALFVVLQYV